MYYDYVTSKSYEDEDNRDMLFKYIKQEQKFRRNFSNYIDNITHKYEQINKNQSVKITNIKRKEE